MSFQTLDLMTQEISMLVALSRTLLLSIYLLVLVFMTVIRSVHGWRSTEEEDLPSFRWVFFDFSFHRLA